MFTRHCSWIAATLATITLATMWLCPLPASAEQPQLLYGAMVYIASAPNDGMGGLLAAAIAKRKLPIIISPDKSYATYILAAFSANKAGPVQPPRSHLRKPSKTSVSLVWEGKAVLADARTHAIVWSTEFHGLCPTCDAAPGGSAQPIAERFIKRFQHDLFVRESISDRIDDILAP